MLVIMVLAILHKVVKKGNSLLGHLSRDFEINEGVNYGNIWENSRISRKNSNCKSLRQRALGALEEKQRDQPPRSGSPGSSL